LSQFQGVYNSRVDDYLFYMPVAATDCNVHVFVDSGSQVLRAKTFVAVGIFYVAVM